MDAFTDHALYIHLRTFSSDKAISDRRQSQMLQHARHIDSLSAIDDLFLTGPLDLSDPQGIQLYHIVQRRIHG